VKLVLLKKELFQEREGFVVGGKKIGALQGYFTVSKEELERIISIAQRIWERAFLLSGAPPEMKAHIRFDFVPQISGTPEETEEGYDLGRVGIKDLYEINCHSPECMSCDSLYRKKFPEIAQYTPSAATELAKALSQEYETDEITMVRGNGEAKRSWGDALLGQMNCNGLKVKETSAERAVKEKPSPLWRWGDVDLKGEYAEYEHDFQEWLLGAQENIDVFNTVPKSRGKDIANKRFIAKKEDIILDSKKNLEEALQMERGSYVLKPLRGASGKNIVFGDHTDPREWKKKIIRAYLDGNYGLFKKTLLPKVNLNGVSVAFDLLPSFLATGKELHFLYAVTRMEPWNSYYERRTINVLQGGGYGGTVATED